MPFAVPLNLSCKVHCKTLLGPFIVPILSQLSEGLKFNFIEICITSDWTEFLNRFLLLYIVGKISSNILLIRGLIVSIVSPQIIPTQRGHYHGAPSMDIPYLSWKHICKKITYVFPLLGLEKPEMKCLYFIEHNVSPDNEIETITLQSYLQHSTA